MIPTHSHYLVIDLETTCADDGRIPTEEMETIEIGAVMVKGTTLEVVDVFQSFARPVRHQRLTPFCSHLTHITQADVESAPGFARALRHMAKWTTAFDDSVFCSWSSFDHEQLLRDCERRGVPYPFAARPHIDLKRVFEVWLGGRREVTLNTALRECGLEFVGIQHRALDDARNTAHVLRWLVQR